jgi:predicted DNA-binding protein
VENKRERIVNFRMTNKEYEVLRALSEKEMRTVSQTVRYFVIKAIEQS